MVELEGTLGGCGRLSTSHHHCRHHRFVVLIFVIDTVVIVIFVIVIVIIIIIVVVIVITNIIDAGIIGIRSSLQQFPTMLHGRKSWSGGDGG